MIDRVSEILQRCGTRSSVLPPTELYNEGWLLRLTVDVLERLRSLDYPCSPEPGARWYSEALLPSRFLPTKRGDDRAESFTHVDAVVGHFDISPGERGEAVLSQDAKQFVVIEAKMGSPLSKGVKNAPTYGQAARNVACMAHAIDAVNITPGDIPSLGFYVLAPEKQIRAGVFEDFVTKARISDQVAQRVAQYADVHTSWFEQTFLPTLAHIDVDLLSWEDVIDAIENHDPTCKLREFYTTCLRFNSLRGGSAA